MLFNLLESSLLVHILVFQSRNPGILNASFSITIIASPPLLLLRGGWLQPCLWEASATLLIIILSLLLCQLILEQGFCHNLEDKCVNVNFGEEEKEVCLHFRAVDLV